MSTIDPVPRTPRHTSGNSSLLRLERINKNLLSLKTKLGSYMCEPKTLSLYQRMDALKSLLENMLSNNHELIRSLRNRQILPDDSRKLVQKQFESYKSLELKVLEYIGMAKMHC